MITTATLTVRSLGAEEGPGLGTGSGSKLLPEEKSVQVTARQLISNKGNWKILFSDTDCDFPFSRICKKILVVKHVGCVCFKEIVAESGSMTVSVSNYYYFII